MKNIFITLDGVDGVGKTTVAKLIAEHFAFKYYKSPTGEFATLRSKVESPENVIGRYCFYRLATEHDSTNIEAILKETSVVCDRYIASTFAHHIAMDESIRSIHSEHHILKPDFSFLLYASSEIRDQRIKKRNIKGSDFVIENNSELLDRTADVFLSLDLIFINTDNKEPLDVVSEIISKIKKRRIK
jgi:thymidylate kinase